MMEGQGMGSEPMSFNMGEAPEGERASLWATQERALQEAAWKIACFVTSLHVAARYSTASRRPPSRLK